METTKIITVLITVVCQSHSPTLCSVYLPGSPLTSVIYMNSNVFLMALKPMKQQGLIGLHVFNVKRLLSQEL